VTDLLTLLLTSTMTATRIVLGNFRSSPWIN
jgi:hypothetical protein